ncbi:adenylyl-sulfate kinase [Methylobacterium sp. NMS14P]|uniref:adenylyl-sulfate kinase n=1 Tax=Methylobacterium sp. NMS14P TaxID=2894310 RepID=UPI002359D919|nr:adenylyl-sulfate kinase [Methylobacterium sp. NMS14P]WCS26392.1 adenylyl-sulfate kinase [Methylobacterium sp. NMS14P]
MDRSRGPSPNRNLTWQHLQPREQRWNALGQRPVIAWLTGLSGAGKSTIANVVDQALTASGRATMVLDGDNLRHGLNSDLGFTDRDRAENVRRVAETAKLVAEAGLIIIVSLISPFSAERKAARAIAGDVVFLEVFVDTPLTICEGRDPKGLYTRARAGMIPNFTGISAPYEAPMKPDVTLATAGQSIGDTAQPLIDMLLQLSTAGHHYLPNRHSSQRFDAMCDNGL